MSTVDLVANVCDVWGGNDAGRGEFDPFLAAQAEVGGEQAHPVSENHGRYVKLQLVQQFKLDHLSEQRAATGNRHVLPVRRGTGLPDSAVYAVGDVGEAGAALPLQGLSRPIGDHEHWGARKGGVSPHGISPPSAMRRPITYAPADLNVSAMTSELVFCSPP